VPVNSIIIDYDKDSTLYIGTDAGVFYTDDLGNTWSVLGPGLPNSPVFDINYHQPTRKLVAGTHGRSLFEFDLDGITSIENDNKIIAEDFELYQNYPNPFNPSTRIAFTLTSDSNVKISVYDITGQKIVDIINNNYQAGKHEVHFNGSDLSSGIYFYKITANGSDGRTYSNIKKMILMK